jgi:iron complex transport system ATP-binding protein
MDSKPLIQVDDVYFSYSKKPVLAGISLQISRGEIVTFLGPNGCGKSTLIKVMVGVLSPLRGRVLLDGQDTCHFGLKHLAREIAYVPQIHKSTFPYSVLDIALMGRIPHKTFFFKYTKEDIETAYDALERLSILHLADRPYTEISGGERQLTIIARALTQGANTFVMDEPATGLDYGNQLRLLEQITKLSQEGYTFIKSTHSPEHALWIADRAIMIKEGCVMADGPCEEVVNDGNLFRLYDARVNVVRAPGSFWFCVPQTISNRRDGKNGGDGYPGKGAANDGNRWPRLRNTKPRDGLELH